MNEKVSVIIPTYNNDKYLGKCIDSVLKQTYKNIEIIIINDGSTDKTDFVVEKYKDERIKYYKNKNQGIGKSRNYGIKQSSGEYLMFVDSDDYINENAVEEMIKKITSDNLDMLICDFYKVENEIEEVKLIDFDYCSISDKPELLLEINLSPWNKIYKKDLIIRNKIFFNEKLKYEDVEFVIDCLIKAKKIGKLNKILYYYVIHKKSETTIRDEKCFDIIKVINGVRKKYADKYYLKDTMNRLTVQILTNYTIQQRYQLNKNVATNFINSAFLYLKENVKDYKKMKYYKKRGIKAIIERNRVLTILYCNMYRKINNIKRKAIK